MNSELLWVLTLLLIAIVLFTSNKLRMDIVALLVIIAFVISGTLTLGEATSGFSDPNVLLIAALFVIGEGLVRTGVAYQMGDWLVRVAGNSETKMLALLMMTVAGLGAFMSSTGVVAIFIPVVLSVAVRMKISPGRLMMPLSFAGLISGMMTLVATPPNMVVNSELIREGLPGFKFFSITPIGILILFAGMGYMLIARHWLANHQSDKGHDKWHRRTFRDLIRDYKLSGRARRLAIRSGSPLIGLSLDESNLRARYGANVVGIERWRRFRRVMVSAMGNTELRERDVLLVDMSDSEVDLRQFCSEQLLEPMVLRGEYFSEQSRNVGMAEVSLIPESDLLGKSLREIGFRTCYGLNVVGIRRDGESLSGKLVDAPLQLGDILLVIGDWKLIRVLQTKMRDFIVLNLPVEIEEVAPATSQAPHALFSLALMVAMMLTDEIPNVIAALIACLLMGKFRCIDMESAYRSIHWPSIILIVGMMPFALALQKTGGIELIVRGLMDIAGDMGPRVMLVCLFILCAVIGLFISNTATAVLMAPIAIAAAREMAVSPMPFAMIIGVAASAAFMTPVSSPVNTLVLGPGGYKFSDFVRLGVPFTLLVMVISVLVIPWLFPF
ncbi:TRAP transporter large permease subunit [Photorhabdus laumondii subsp. laumondii]|uniref:Photorhabdus luminescens subsp. laumondii TTO1 complete genome segment 11/17 n=2 Tax=Photorhabdus laumondii subsp. laumondii TaxID=141679 RepID=Q7N2I3_PHOLL|nr:MULTISPECIES: SLC13 family permease [Photorhabdus]AXG48111.1 SLC13 family permease [Photorhabdus laumondii subsp. laumondii]MCC8386223.1 SLC13 family permease [Photorhabdus laumondii]MCC8415231.1 SLC13 family permease [Photorhabdus laumondii]NDK96583.1 TRAP transporter large permease subunit [Photorhabdus laumondii subsp. laumondii]NDL22790.1 TRAP transporter large permease subunit [Photorhabdus laumondii subsp. laumondii]